jgi:ATP-binding cassette subfamily B protein
LGRQTTRVYEHIADANEMTEILLTPLEITDTPNAKNLIASHGKIEFKNVGFGYHENLSVLDKFNITINPGERVAFVGPSGGGKSTITKLLFRFYNIDSGEILIDGQNILNIKQESLWKNLSLVPQEPILFHRSLLENIRYGKPDASEKEIMQASKLAHAHEFISSFPEGYHTLVGERGIKLSGGERQRIAIARAILKNAPILVLDEATSSLDSESEMYIQDALKSIMSAKGGSTSDKNGKTVIVIAHRLSTIMQMDRIVVIENGKIIEQGKHQELIKMKQGMYQKLWEIQAGGFIDEK